MSFDLALVPVDPWPEGYEFPEDRTECNGACLSAYDIGLAGYGIDRIAYPHPSCPKHGMGFTYPGDDYFEEDDWRQGSMTYVRTGDMVCERCSKLYSAHMVVKLFDSLDGQPLVLFRVCDGRLVKL